MEPWLVKLAQGDTQACWDLFVERYRRLIVATIRRLLPDHDDAMDVFSVVCEAFTADNYSRLRRYSEGGTPRASVATWLVVVVRNLTLDWLRVRDGRRRLTVPAGLSPLQHEIYRAVCIDGYSPVEAYERVGARQASTLPFHLFLREVRETQRRAPCPRATPPRRPAGSASIAGLAEPATDLVESEELVRRIAHALASQPHDVRLAVELFVVERLSADDVARAVGWPNAKAVYNRVHRALAALRAGFERDGIGRGDL